MTAPHADVYRSRWGFHPCDWETYWKLKLIHKWHWQTVRDFASWRRWKRRLPTNRVIRRWIRDGAGRKIRHEIVGPRPEPRYCPCFVQQGQVTDLGFVRDYHTARMPKATPEDVSQLEHAADEIDRVFNRVKSWLELNGRPV